MVSGRSGSRNGNSEREEIANINRVNKIHFLVHFWDTTNSVPHNWRRLKGNGLAIENLVVIGRNTLL